MKHVPIIAVILVVYAIATPALSQSNSPDRKTQSVATGPAALPALMAAVIDSRISALEFSGTIGSFAEITSRPTDKDWFSYLVPGIMKFFDIPDLMKMRSEMKIRYVGI